MCDDSSSWPRRRVLKLTGVSAAGTVALSRTGAATDGQADVSGEPRAQTSDGSSVTLVEADPEAGFDWPYLLSAPSVSDSSEGDGSASDGTDTRPLVVGNSPWRGVPSDAERRLESGRGHLENGRLRAITSELGCPGLVALVPSRAEDGSYQNLRLSAGAFDRLDRQLLAMVDDARERLADQPYDVPEAFHVDGFSSNGRFFDKLTALHPERINAVSAGGNGIVVLPLETLSEDIPTAGDPSVSTLPWPVGVGDLPELIGTEFDAEAWFETAQFWYIGVEDQDPENPGRYLHKLYKGSGETADLIGEVFGSLQVDDRFRTSEAILEQLGAKAQFTAYEGAGHEVTREMVRDYVEFHRRHKHEAFGPQFARAVEWPSGPVAVADTLDVVVTYENLGATETTTTATLLVDGEPADTTEVTVAPGGTERVEFAYSFTSPGEHTVSVDEAASKSFEVTAAESESGSSDGTDSTDQSSSDDGSTGTEQPGFGLAQAITAMAGLGYALKRRVSAEGD